MIPEFNSTSIFYDNNYCLWSVHTSFFCDSSHKTLKLKEVGIPGYILAGHWVDGSIQRILTTK